MRDHEIAPDPYAICVKCDLPKGYPEDEVCLCPWKERIAELEAVCPAYRRHIVELEESIRAAHWFVKCYADAVTQPKVEQIDWANPAKLSMAREWLEKIDKIIGFK